MGRKFKVWLDSGANIESRYEDEVDLDFLGVSSEEWENMNERERDELMKDVAWERMDWGYKEITDE
ncbi:hypothetical protein HQN64_18945 [Enterobacteriaceae bacterium BIT-l23]|uniref:DUF7167 domain-containing protein n=1 Tax=Jejubacter calystegiae TaxID=2579935 RepID=A0A4P8YPT8_9ENTR|nr:hypothetical protein [Jejubacter calystegiae]NUU68165.1 hypothetical protein [Enterobacteriaceae bacterium BIT-l23]QCT21804.1 hypothetical protein FEM41_20175 [Jejubacter calystegiae]